MNDMEKNTMIEKEQKAVKALHRLGFSKMEAHIILFLFKTGGVTAKDIEKSTRLKQPEVSQGINALINRKWVKTSKIPNKGLGRPRFEYRLNRPKKEIIGSIQREIQKRIETEEQGLALLCELMEI